MINLRILKVLIIVLLVGYVFALGINPYNVERDDQYTYDYFNSVLNSFSNIFKSIIEDNNTCINQSRNVFKELNCLKNETVLYSAHNITSPVGYVIQPFYKFSKELVYLCNLNMRLKEDISKNTTESLVDAKATVMEINKTLILMENTLDNIDNITYLKKGNETLKFNTSNIRELINLYKSKILKYNMNISIAGLRIYISDNNPIIFENVTIYGIAKNGNITIFIGNSSYNFTVKNNTFSMIYSFKKDGLYKIYAKQNNKTSNILYVNVSKIPTCIYTDKEVYRGYANSNITLNGYVVDWYGKRVNGVVYIMGIPIVLNNGSFTYNIFSNKPTNETITIFYKGSSIYLTSNKTVNVEFLKRPTRIVISTNKYNVTTGETITITGNFFGVNSIVDIYIVVNNETYKSIKTNGEFITNISFNSSGIYNIYAVYPGNDVYDSCRSNILTINVKERSYISYIIVVALIALIGGYAYIYKFEMFKKKRADNKKKDKKSSEDRYINVEGNRKIEKKDDKDKLVSIPDDDITKAYTLLFNTLVEKYSLPRNLTPRELLNIIKTKNPNIYDDLKFITDIHEKHVYGKYDINKETLNKYIQKIKEVLNKI